MTVNLKILACEKIEALQSVEELDTKRLVPKMMLRRRLTRAAKLFVYLADRCAFANGPVVYGSAFGELGATAEILHAVEASQQISPTAFQNSVYNTAGSYFSILRGDRDELLTLSSGHDTARDVISTAALQSLVLGKEVLMLCTETLDIENIAQVNRCSDYLEAGVACRVMVTDEAADTALKAAHHEGYPPSLWHMLDICAAGSEKQSFIIEVTL